ncbi:MAG: dihydrofolate reductase family protein [Desulfobacteraceae bacterium]
MKTILVMAATLDGKIGRDSCHPADWTGQQDKKIFVQLTKNAGAVIMGRKTFDTIGRALPERKNIVMTRSTIGTAGEGDLVFTSQPPGDILESLALQGHETAALIGGAQVNSLFLRKKLIDEIYLTIVPKIFGTGLSLFNDEADLDLELDSVQQLNQGSLLVHYWVK